MKYSALCVCVRVCTVGGGLCISLESRNSLPLLGACKVLWYTVFASLCIFPLCF